ncbi:hypothetical protein M1N57_01505 [Dehalococcoidales bacterium]|nr:hypothetical protein [Dehalococcoidales bacterium]
MPFIAITPGWIANSVERYMSNQLGRDSSLVNSAQRQQGLIDAAAVL